MHPLREAILDQMHLRGHPLRTQQCYLHAVSLLSRHYHRSPDRLSQDELQNWILYLVKDRQRSPPPAQALGIVYRVISMHLARKPGYSQKTARIGAVTLIQQFGRPGAFMPCGYRVH
jgi:hypothetical protein